MECHAVTIGQCRCTAGRRCVCGEGLAGEQCAKQRLAGLAPVAAFVHGFIEVGGERTQGPSAERACRKAVFLDLVCRASMACTIGHQLPVARVDAGGQERGRVGDPAGHFSGSRYGRRRPFLSGFTGGDYGTISCGTSEAGGERWSGPGSGGQALPLHCRRRRISQLLLRSRGVGQKATSLATSLSCRRKATTRSVFVRGPCSY